MIRSGISFAFAQTSCWYDLLYNRRATLSVRAQSRTAELAESPFVDFSTALELTNVRNFSTLVQSAVFGVSEPVLLTSTSANQKSIIS